MSAETNRVPVTVRLRAEDKSLFVEKAEAFGIESGIAARQVLELVIQRMRDGADFLDALHELKVAMKKASEAEQESNRRSKAEAA